ncbi:class I SAM-dependent methyltransferase [Actinomycetes bacterium KLBMP 9759]
MTPDEYGPAAPYLHLLVQPAWTGLRPAFAAELASVDPGAGSVVELGSGSGIGTELLLETVPGAPVLAAEPSAQLRAVLLGRIAAHPQAHRLTVRACRAQDLVLPDRISAVLGAHMAGHLDAASRHALWRTLAARLTPGAPVMLTVEPPDSVRTVPELPPVEVTVAGLTYRGTGSAVPDGDDSVEWRMHYSTLDGNRVVHTAEARYRWHVLSADRLAAELADAGLRVTSRADGRVVARAPGPVPAATGAGRLRARTMLADPGRAADWRHLLAHEAAAESGLLDALPGTAIEVATRTGLVANAVHAVLGLLTRSGDVVADAGPPAVYRRAEPARDAEEEALLLTQARALRRWSQVLAARLRARTAGPETTSPAPPLRLDTLAAVARPLLGPVADACLRHLPPGGRVLDLGGGHGAFARSIAARGAPVVLQDLPVVIDQVGPALAEAGITTFGGDMRETLAPGPFGLVLLSTVTNMFDAAVNGDLLARVHDVLVPGGTVVIVSYLRGRAPVADAFGVQMLCFSDGGDAHDEAAYREWLAAAGFETAEVTDLVEPPQTLIAGTRS